jgi:hypothetical protein
MRWCRLFFFLFEVQFGFWFWFGDALPLSPPHAVRDSVIDGRGRVRTSGWAVRRACVRFLSTLLQVPTTNCQTDLSHASDTFHTSVARRV